MNIAGSINALLKALKALMHRAVMAVVRRRQAQADAFIRQTLRTHGSHLDASV